MTATVIFGAPVKDRAWALSSWCDAIGAQEGQHPVVALYSASEDTTEGSLKELGVEVVYDEEPGRTVQHIDAHSWGTVHWYQYMARIRNRLLDLMIERDADYFFSLDTDILLPPHALTWMLEVMGQERCNVLAPAVNMGRQMLAWNTMHWHGDMAGTAQRSYYPDRRGPVDVIMAAMLLDRRAIETCRWVHHYQGEDVGFCLDAEQKGISRWWMPEIVCTHLMTRM